MKSHCRRTWLATLAGLAACAGSPAPHQPVPVLPREQLIASVYLIGDAGAPAPDAEPVLQALSRELQEARGERVVLFLGDNIYPRGLPPPDHAGRAEAERRLDAQIDVVTRARAKGYFVLGNHDWARDGDDGWRAARRQGDYVDSAGPGLVSVEPRGGCPGPSVVDLGRRLRLVLVDTQWWLHPGARPAHPSSSCPTDSPDEVVDSLRSALLAADERLVIVAGHHPLSSGGIHGGYFGWKDHVFPLRLVVPGLWLPLPFIGSLYPSARQHGISNQDIPSAAYQRLIAAFRKAFAEAPPALYAAGHEHNLQVIAGGSAQLELVSGAGIYGHNGRVVAIDGTLYARRASGFARLDIPHTGRARLAVLEVDGNGGSREAFSTWVNP